MSTRKSDLILLGTVVLLGGLALAVLSLFAPTRRTGGEIPQPSTYFNAPYGLKAAFLALDRMHFVPSRVRRPLELSTLEPLDALFILRPIEEFAPFEQAALLEWTRAG